MGAFSKGSRFAEEDDNEINAPIFVKYDRVLHGQERKRGRKGKNERLTIKFLKKYIHYAKNRIQPKLTDEVNFVYSHVGEPVNLCMQHHCELYFSF